METPRITDLWKGTIMSTTPGAAFGLPDDAMPVDETPELDAETFDISTWIGGVYSTVRSVTLYQRADLLAEIDELERQVKLAETAAGGVPEGEASLGGDDDVSVLRARLKQTLQEFSASALTFRVQGRSDDWREQADKRLKKEGVTDELERSLRALAESIIIPVGVKYEHLAHLMEVSEPQVKMLLVAWTMANTQVPRVSVPFSPPSSPRTGGRRSS